MQPLYGKITIFFLIHLNISCKHMLFFPMIVFVENVTIDGKWWIGDDKIDTFVREMFTGAVYTVLIIVDIPHQE